MRWNGDSRRSGCFVLLLLMAAGCIGQTQFKSGSLTINTKYDNLYYRVEVADNPRLKSIGLMYRSNLPANQGMLLLNEKPQPLEYLDEEYLYPA